MEYTIALIENTAFLRDRGIHLYALNKYDDVARLVKESGIKDM
jgi:hypothetical protein